MLNATVGEKVLITTHGHFLGPDGLWYRAAFGTLKSICGALETLGIQPRPPSTNWYLEIGNMTIAGCQVMYVVKAESCVLGVTRDHQVDEKTGEVRYFYRPSLIFTADDDYVA